MKRTFDMLVALLVLVLGSPLLLTIAIAIKLTSRGPALYRHTRVGQDFAPFDVLKFRTMASDSSGPDISAGDDTRITRVGALLRSTKLDELPQFLNVLKGEMSVVGPRPEVAKYVECQRDAYSEILRVRPGITDPASIRFRNEQELLAGQANPEKYYVDEILPIKVSMSMNYVDSQSFREDLRLIGQTVRAVTR